MIITFNFFSSSLRKHHVWKPGQAVMFLVGLCICVRSLSHVQFFATPWTVAHLASLSMEFSRQEYWSGLPFATPGESPWPGIKLMSPASVGRFFTTVPPGKPSNRTRNTHFAVSVLWFLQPSYSLRCLNFCVHWIRSNQYKWENIFITQSRNLLGIIYWSCKLQKLNIKF